MINDEYEDILYQKNIDINELREENRRLRMLIENMQDCANSIVSLVNNNYNKI